MVRRLINSGDTVVLDPRAKPHAASPTSDGCNARLEAGGRNTQYFDVELKLEPHSSGEINATGVVIWLLSLYHMTGKSEVALDLCNKTTSDLIAVDSRRSIGMTLEPCATPKTIRQAIRSSAGQDDICLTNECQWNSEDCVHTLVLAKDFSEISSYELQQDQESRVHLCHDKGVMTLRIEWADGLQDRDEMISIIERVATHVFSHHGAPISSMQSPASGQLRLASLDPPPPVCKEQTINELFHVACAQWPSKLAVDAWDGSFTYHELDAVSSRWASTLASEASFSEQRVLHVFDHSRWAIVAWLALLKAGCACVPVDTSAPEERIKSIVRNTGCTGALCDSSQAKSLASLVRHVMTPDELNNKKNSSDVCYGAWKDSSPGTRASMIMHTSGSTGEPKGALQSHVAVTTSLVRVSEALHLDETSRFLQFASHSFDVSISEIFTPLCVGGCIVIPNPEDKVASVAKNIRSMRATHVIMTPTVVRTFAPEEVPGLRNISLGGERASSELRKLWSSRLDLNILYGTTETAVWDTIAQVTAQNCDSSRLIGKSIGSRAWVVHPNDWTKLSPIGVAGEICIQGPEIGDYYVGRPEQTARVFKSAPGWLPKGDMDDASHRIYRTGDLGRVLKDGNLEIWGRIDRQIKLNGQRMEPAEIEESLMRFLPGNLRVYVELLQPKNGKARLAAFVSYEEDADPTLSTLTTHQAGIRKAFDEVQAVLPRSMIPTVTVPLTNFPLTVSKKINRLELQKLGLAFLDSKKQADAPKLQNGHSSSNANVSDAQAMVQRILDFIKSRTEGSAGQDMTLNESGLDSLDAVEVSSGLRRVAQLHVPASMLLRPGIKISDIAALSNAPEQNVDPKASLREELVKWTVKLDEASTTAGRAVLLTGASGFLGREILRQLLSHAEQWTVVCVVRGDSPEHARQRLLSVVSKEKWWTADFEPRIEVWPGDLSLPKLGLRQAEWREVFGLHGSTRRVHTIIHNGAVVNWLASYEALTDPNVGSTYELLRGQLQSHDAPGLVFVSGGYISGQEETVDELASKIYQMPGYDQTKFVSETMVAHFNASLARNSGGQAWVFKPGFIIGSSTDGETQTRDALWRFVKACAQIGMYSEEDARKWIPVAGVDAIAANLVAELSVRHSDKTKEVCHKVLAGCYLQDIWDMLKELGLELKNTAHGDWLAAMNSRMEADGREHPLFPLKEWMVTSKGFMGTEPPKDGRVTDDDNADARLAVQRSMEHLTECGFLARS